VPPDDFEVPFEVSTPQDVYDAEVAYVDAQFGRLVDTLHADGRLDRTLLAVTADHGQGLGDHGWWNHRLLYQEHIRLPLVLRFPGEPAGAVVDELVRSVDLYPTLLEAAGVHAPASVEGRSLLPLWRGEPDAPRSAYADQLNLWDTNAVMLEKRPDDDLLHVWMDREWKLIHRPTAPERSELYHLTEDPGELVNVYADHPEVAARMLVQLEALGAFRAEGFGDVEAGDARTEALNALGYLGGDEE
jgi:arylsulfatase A-like enzyme